MATDPWSKFAVGIPNPHSRRPENARMLLTLMTHVAHVGPAMRILEDGCFVAHLVHDESILSTERVSVVWLSPNDWKDGSLYGNVCFKSEWTALVQNKCVYWVEVKEHDPPALRFLITNERHQTFRPYRLSSDRGPLQQGSDGKRYWNGTYNLEVMYEGDLPIDRVTEHTCQPNGAAN